MPVSDFVSLGMICLYAVIASNQINIYLLYLHLLLQGMFYSRIVQKSDINVTLGVADCKPIIRYTDVHIYCQPPADKPNKNINDTFCNQESDWLTLSVSLIAVFIGSKLA